MTGNGFHGGETVGWELHHKRGVFTFHHPTTEHTTHDDGQQDTDGIERNHDGALVFHGKEGADNHDIDG